MAIGQSICGQVFGRLGRPIGQLGPPWQPMRRPGGGNAAIAGYSPDLRQLIVAGSAGIFVSGNGGRTFIQATNGVPSPRTWRAIAWSPALGLWAIVAQDAGLVQAVITSPDGLNWTPRNTPNDAAAVNWSCMVWGESDGLFVALRSAPANGGMSSPDGINWTFRSPGVRTWSDVNHGNGIFAGVAQNGGGGSGLTQRVATSPDGITWTLRDTPMFSGISPNWRSIAFSPSLNRWVIVAHVTTPGDATSGHLIATSDNGGATWTDRGTPAGYENGQINWVRWSDQLGIFLASTNIANVPDRQYAIWSADGITWQGSHTPVYNNDINGYLRVVDMPEFNGMYLTTSSVGDNATNAFTRTGK